MFPLFGWSWVPCQVFSTVGTGRALHGQARLARNQACGKSQSLNHPESVPSPASALLASTPGLYQASQRLPAKLREDKGNGFRGTVGRGHALSRGTWTLEVCPESSVHITGKGTEGVSSGGPRIRHGDFYSPGVSRSLGPSSHHGKQRSSFQIQTLSDLLSSFSSWWHLRVWGRGFLRVTLGSSFH